MAGDTPASHALEHTECRFRAVPNAGKSAVWLVIYQTIRLVICQAALTRDLDPSRISFTAARDTALIATTPGQAPEHLARACEDLCRRLITRHVHTRVFPRTLKHTLSRYPYRGKTRQLTSGHASYQTQIVPPDRTRPTPGSQATPAQPRAA